MYPLSVMMRVSDDRHLPETDVDILVKFVSDVLEYANLSKPYVPV